MTEHRLSANQREALELLASDPQGATDELLVLVHGFDSNMIADLDENGLAMARLENMKAGSRAIEVVRIRITDARDGTLWPLKIDRLMACTDDSFSATPVHTSPVAQGRSCESR